MANFTVSKKYLYYRLSLAFVTYLGLSLLSYFLLHYFDYAKYFPLVGWLLLIGLALTLFRSFFYCKYATLHFTPTAIIVTKGKLFRTKTTIPLDKVYLIAERTDPYLKLFNLKKITFQTIAQAASFAGIEATFKLPVKVGGHNES